VRADARRLPTRHLQARVAVRRLLLLLVACGRVEAAPPVIETAKPIATSAPDAGDRIWIAFGKKLPREWVECRTNDDCEVAVAIPVACWPVAANKAHLQMVIEQLSARIDRGETCNHPGCGLEFHESECKRSECRLLDGCTDPGGSN